jgi:HD-GYP domain-containing protein (c-di-GMP phosphodiesterase class II)
MPGKNDERDLCGAALADTLCEALRQEFQRPFTIFDSVTGSVVHDGGVSLDAEAVVALAKDVQARVTPLGPDRVRLSLPLYSGGKPIWLAVSDGPAQDVTVLQGWLQAASERQRLADQLVCRRRAEEAQTARASTAWEALLALDQLARRLRLHKEPSRNPQRVLESAHGLLGVETLLWVPHPADQPVVAHGEARLSPDDCRQLAAALGRFPGLRASEPLLCNDVSATDWGTRFPGLVNLMAFLVTDQGILGWVVAVNKKGGGPFRRSDAALLLPFVALLELHLRWRQRHQEMKDLLVGLTRALTTALDAKDAYTFGHSERVARIAVELGREMGLVGEELGDLYLAGLLHDVGKIGIKDTVLHKPSSLSPEEQEHIQQHVTIGYWILAELRQIRNLLPGVLYHHERFDGAGYPDGLAGEDIPLLARILAVADAYDAMSHARPYRDSMPYRRVEEILAQGAGSQWDRRVVEAFLRCRQRIHTIRQRGVGESLRQAIDGALRGEAASIRSLPRLPLASALLSAEQSRALAD